MGSVKLVSITEDAEKQIVFIARVSNPVNQHNPELSKLVRYLLENHHYSPFEHAYVTFEIKTSIPIAEQMLRHVSFRFQKFSGRYSTMEQTEPIELRRQATKNRQSSEDIFDPQLGPYAYESTDTNKASQFINNHIQESLLLYNQLLSAGVAKECARFVLPLATSTTLYMTGSIRSWIHYLALRNDEHTQKEHRLLAIEIENILRRELPVTFKALDDIKRDNERNAQLLRILKDHKIYTEELLLEALLSSPTPQ